MTIMVMIIVIIAAALVFVIISWLDFSLQNERRVKKVSAPAAIRELTAEGFDVDDTLAFDYALEMRRQRDRARSTMYTTIALFAILVLVGAGIFIYYN